MQLVADEDCFSIASCWTEYPRNFQGYLGFFTFNNLYVGYLFYDFSRNTCVSRNPDWKWLFYDMRLHQGAQGNRLPTLLQQRSGTKKFSPSFRSRTEFRWLRCCPKRQNHSFPYNRVQNNVVKQRALVVWFRIIKHDVMFAFYVHPLLRLVQYEFLFVKHTVLM